VIQQISALEDFSLFIRNGASIKQTDGAKGDPITRIETIANRTVNLAKCGYADVSSEYYEKYLLQEGDILISHINSTKHLGKCAIYEGDEVNIIHGMNLLCLRVDENKAHAKYVFYMLSSSGFLEQLPKITKNSVNQSSFNVKSFQKLNLPLPPLDTQKKIAAVLEKADQLRKDCQQMEQDLNRLAQSVFIDMFGDPVTNPMGWDVKSLIDLLLSKPQIGTTTPSHEDGTQKVVRVGELGKHEVNYKKCGAITLEGAALERYKLFEGDYLLARAIGSRNHLGKASLFVEQSGVYVYDSHVMRLRFNSNLMPSKFFYELMKTNGGRSLFLNSSAQTAVQFNINAKQISQIELPVPPIELQNDYLEKLDKIKNLFSLNNANTSEQNSNFESLMQKAFKGELNL